MSWRHLDSFMKVEINHFGDMQAQYPDVGVDIFLLKIRKQSRSDPSLIHAAPL